MLDSSTCMELHSNLLMLSLVLSSHLYLKVTFFLSDHRKFIGIELLLRGHLSY